MWKPELQGELFVENQQFVRSIVMRFYKGKTSLNNIWRELYSSEKNPNAASLDDVGFFTYDLFSQINFMAH